MSNAHLLLEATRLVLHSSPWLTIHLYLTGMVVARSIMLPETDREYAPVAGLIDAYNAELTEREIVADPAMIFGRAERSVYTFREGVTLDEQYLRAFAGGQVEAT